MDAAIQVFAARGFYNARVSDIAREAGVADGTIYLYFKNKDDLLISLFEDRMDGIISTFREALEASETSAEALRRYIELHLQMVQSEPALAEVLTVELRQSAKFMRDYKAPKFGEYLDLLHGVIERGRANGEFRQELNPRILTRALFGALDEISLVWVSTRRKPFSLEGAVDTIWSLFAHGLGVRPGEDGKPASDR
jgi:TetR/AcrR family fatty acid metabolism transcriptional regulator